MPKYRVTYVESTLRERFIDADSPEAAEEAVQEEFANGQHHHMLDSWNDDWQAEETTTQTPKTRCSECG